MRKRNSVAPARADEGHLGDGNGYDVVLTVYNISTRQVQFVATVQNDFEGPGPDAPAPFPTDDVGDGAVVSVMAKESTVGEDVNGDGVIDDAMVVVLTGDVDGDGTFDDLDTCLATPNVDQTDADADGLGDSTCDPHPPIPCPVEPLVGCRTTMLPAKSSLGITKASTNAKDALKWTWSAGDATTLADLGDPANGGAAYSLCVYDGSSTPQPLLALRVGPGGTCGLKPCWKATGVKGYKFKDKLGAQTGVQGIALKTGEAGKAKVGFKGIGAGLGVHGLPTTTPVKVQLQVTDGPRVDCWEATFDTPLTNTAGVFKAKSN